MPAPEVPRSCSLDNRPALGHVNLMVDTFIGNANVEDLRAAIRGLLSSGIPGVANAFVTSARVQLQKTSNPSLLQTSQPIFVRSPQTGSLQPTKRLVDLLIRARSMYGVGMAFASLDILVLIVDATFDLRWEPEDEFADTLAMIDADIAQALQSCKEELEGGRVDDSRLAHDQLSALKRAVDECHSRVESWRGELPYERASASLEHMKI
ncbi:hypothetical protein ONZ45_g7815 [Pleurotus djamor]|nr:hypothetical protein ONZ45_g19464 [Pleurotus djamor]KAJ8514669.1 hypothetical protein ONZ45_g7815 [Pleurotus djamor]